MDDVENDTTSNHVSQRSPSFNKQEVSMLIKLVEKYKNIILNKSTNSTTNHAKEVVWSKIRKEFNSQGFKNTRSDENLRTKWENIKKEARKMSKNIIDVDDGEYNDLLSQVVILMNESDTMCNNLDVLTNEMENEYVDESNEKCSDDEAKLYNQSNGGDIETLKMKRSYNFSPQECSLLLRCVRPEKQHVFSKENTGRAILLKHNAWSRITSSFNKSSPQKRSTKTLRTKFNNMMKCVKSANIKGNVRKQHTRLEEEHDGNVIKSEPMLEYTADADSNSDMSVNGEVAGENEREDGRDAADPLSTVLNCDSGIDSFNHFGSSYEDKEVAKLKLDLLKYQMETAKIERQGIQERIEYERSERESKAIEIALRLRSARLQVAAAEGALPAAHPALRYTAQETRAGEYLHQLTNT